MIIKALAENTSISDEYGSEHGLCLFIETQGLKVLFDVGASELFFENARKLDADIAYADFLVISHGHYDHGGGLGKFLLENNTAKVFVHGNAFEKHYSMRRDGNLAYIGLEEELKCSRQIALTSDKCTISKGIEVFSNITQTVPRPLSNRGLFVEKNGQMEDDTFDHEQNLIIEEDGKTLLITGCAHNGIINILEHFHRLKCNMPDFVIGGFHLSSRSSGGDESFDTIDKIGRYLLDTKAKYYTCHCTGIEPYNRLKAVMGESIDYLSAGSRITI